MTEAPIPRLPFTTTLRAIATDFLTVWLLLSFVRMFVVENYRIPSGSMTPTLVGGKIAHFDVDGDGDLDYVLVYPAEYEVFINTGTDYVPRLCQRLPQETEDRVRRLARRRYDNILVDKCWYWFRKPERGDIAVFKTPRGIFNRSAPIYVKRVVGRPGETLRIAGNRLWVDGKPVEAPPFFRNHFYDTRVQLNGAPFEKKNLGENEYLFFGDNSLNSYDGRAWGPVPSENVKGRVFFRYWPLANFGVVK